MAHFHHRHAAAVPIGHFSGCLLQHLQRQGRWACRKIPRAHQDSLSYTSSTASSTLSIKPSTSSSASLSTTRRTPESILLPSTLLKVTPCVARPISRISGTRLRPTPPPPHPTQTPPDS